MKIQILVLLIGITHLSHATAQETLPEIVKRQRGNVEFRTEREFSPVDLQQLVRDADLIARVVVMSDGVSRLSSDQRSMHSEYPVQVLEQFSSRQTPPGQAVIVRKPGGSMNIEGHQISNYEGDFPPFKRGDEYFLFLKLDDANGQYIVVHGAQGAFRSVFGEVEQVSTDTGTWNREKGRVPILTFINELSSAIASPQQKKESK